MKRVLGGLGRWIWYLAAVLVVLCAAVVSLGQYYFPYLDEYKDELVARFAGELPFGVELSGLHAEWTGLSPTFRVDGLRLYAREDPAVTILSSRRSEVRIDLVRSLLALAPRLRRIEADDVAIGFLQEADGRWHVAGLGAGRAPARRDEILAFFLAIEAIELRHTRLELSPAGGARVDTEDAELALENYRLFRRLRLRARDPAQGGRLDLLVEASGDPRQSAAFDASAHAALDRVRARLQPLFGARALPQGELSGELWARIDHSGRATVQGQLSAPHLELPPLASGRTFDPLHALDTRFALDWAGAHATLWLDRLHAQWYGQDLALDHVRVDGTPSQSRLELAAEYLELGSLAPVVLASGVLGEPWASVLADLAPYGGLAESHLVVEKQGAQPANFDLRARLVDFSASPWRDAPGVRNVRGVVHASAAEGRVDIDSGAVTLEFPHLYHEDLDFDSVRGSVTWRRDAEGLVVGSERVQVQDDETAFEVMFRLRYFRDPRREDELSLAVGLRNGTAAMQRRYVPYVVDEGLRQWLARSVHGGRVDEGMFALRMGFGRGDRRRPLGVQLALDVEDAAVDYHPEWPAISEAHARLLVDGKSVRVWADSGRVLDSHVDEALVEIDLARNPHRLEVKGRLHGDLGDGLRVIDDSPLARLTHGVLHQWSGDGEMQVALDLDMPLGAAPARENSRVEVRARIDTGRLQLANYDLQLESVTGGIDYSLDRGLSSRDLKATLWGRPLTAQLGPPEGAAPEAFGLRVEGSATAPDIERWLGASTAASVSGETAFRLQVRQDGSTMRTRLESDLAGIASNLPVPLAKDAQNTLPLALEWWTVADGISARAGLGDAAHIAVDLANGRTPAGEIVVGGGTAPQAGGDGLRLRGSVVETDAGAWIVATQHLLAANAGRAGGEAQTFRLSGVEIENAKLLRATLHDVRVQSHWEDGEFVLDFVSDLGAGRFRAPAARAEPLVLTLERLELQPFFSAEEQAQAHVQPGGAGEWAALQGAHVPPLDVEIAALRMGPRDLGHWRFRIADDSRALQMSGVQAELPGLEIGGVDQQRPGARLRLGWVDGTALTELDAAVQLHDAGAFFDSWGLERALESKRGHAEISLRWPGNPTDLEMAAASGTMDFSFHEGRLLHAGTSNPLMRAIGLMRFDELLRRLKFDFKDLYQSGLVFDRFEASIDLGDGAARTREPMELEGPSARMRLEGRSDLRARQIDADLIVTLPIGSNLPWVAALAGGPAVAAGVLVASRLFKDELGKFSSAVYKVTGPLDDPKLEFQKVFDVDEAPGGTAPSAPSSSTSATSASPPAASPPPPTAPESSAPSEPEGRR